jgi:hypothetical protein
MCGLIVNAWAKREGGVRHRLSLPPACHFPYGSWLRVKRSARERAGQPVMELPLHPVMGAAGHSAQGEAACRGARAGGGRMIPEGGTAMGAATVVRPGVGTAGGGAIPVGDLRTAGGEQIPEGRTRAAIPAGGSLPAVWFPSGTAAATAHPAHPAGVALPSCLQAYRGGARLCPILPAHQGAQGPPARCAAPSFAAMRLLSRRPGVNVKAWRA